MRKCLSLNVVNRRIAKFLSGILIILLLFSFVLSLSMIVGSCNEIGLSAEKEVQPGASFTVRVSLSTAANGYESFFSYDESVLSLTRILPSNSSYLDFQVSRQDGYVRVTHQKPVQQMLQFTFTVSSHASIGSKIRIDFYDAKALSDDTFESIANASLEIVVVDRKSSDANLASLQVSVFESDADREQNEDGFLLEIAPAFSPEGRSYNATVTNEYVAYRVTAVPRDAAAVVTFVSDGELKEGEINTVSIQVKAEDGTTAEYIIRIFRESAPPVLPVESYPVASEVESSSESEPELLGTLSEGAFEESEPSVSVAPESMDWFFSQSSATSELVKSDTENWTGVFFWIAVIGSVLLLLLVVRIFVLFHRKQRSKP